MAGNLADELLQMILTSSLTITHDQFVSPSPAAFGENDMVSSASSLLVCKRWLRVATPLLYEAVVIRSTGQSHALADAFRLNPTFARHVKKIRLEGAFASLGEVLMRCTNLKTLVIILRIYSDANVKSLCGMLPVINPRNVILSDQWQIDNAKLRTTFAAFCEAIPKWTKLTTFEYPYHAPGYGTSTRRQQLISALAKSESLRVISCDIPGTHVSLWKPLATMPSVALKFKYRSEIPLHLSLKKVIVDAIKDTAVSESPPEFVDLSEASPPREPKIQSEIAVNPSFNPPPFSSATEHIWTTIFSFAALPGHPDPPDTFYRNVSREFAGGAEAETFLRFNTTRKALSLVCKGFERLVRPMFFVFPLISSANSLHLFLEQVLRDHGLGRYVHTLFLAGLYNSAKVNQDLCSLFPHLICLRHYIGCEDNASYILPYVTPKALTRLAVAAGNSLLTITHLALRDDDEAHLRPSILNFFKQIMRLDVSSSPRVLSDRTDLDPESLSTLYELRLDGRSELLDTLYALRMPRLKSVTINWACTPTIEKFMKAYGSGIEDLYFQGFADLSEVFIHAPKLRDLRWRPLNANADWKDSMVLAASLNNATAHRALQKFTVEGIPNPRSKETEQFNAINTFFRYFDFTRFPSIREIHFASYDWPIEGRAISKDPMPKMAVQVKQMHGVDITDRSGKPWRQRAQKRR